MRKSSMAELDPKLAGVVGHPVTHSRSPEIFAFLSKQLGGNLVYKRIDIENADLPLLLNASSEAQLFVGWNVTVPHKEAICVCLDELTPGARAIGAANVVEFTPSGTRGHNTDWLGVLATWKAKKISLKKGRALMYGAGGAARAVAFAAGKGKLPTLWVHNRSQERAHQLCLEMGRLFPSTSFLPINDPREVSDEISLLVNATTVGMKGAGGKFVFPPNLAKKALAFDLIYLPGETIFLKQAGRLGLQTVGGLPMLAAQAVATWEIWFGKIKQKENLERRLVSFLKKGN